MTSLPIDFLISKLQNKKFITESTKISNEDVEYYDITSYKTTSKFPDTVNSSMNEDWYFFTIY